MTHKERFDLLFAQMQEYVEETGPELCPIDKDGYLIEDVRKNIFTYTLADARIILDGLMLLDEGGIYK